MARPHIEIPGRPEHFLRHVGSATAPTFLAGKVACPALNGSEENRSNETKNRFWTKMS
jgi:hypothetical protein